MATPSEPPSPPLRPWLPSVSNPQIVCPVDTQCRICAHIGACTIGSDRKRKKRRQSYDEDTRDCNHGQGLDDGIDETELLEAMGSQNGRLVLLMGHSVSAEEEVAVDPSSDFQSLDPRQEQTWPELAVPTPNIQTTHEIFPPPTSPPAGPAPSLPNPSSLSCPAPKSPIRAPSPAYSLLSPNRAFTPEAYSPRERSYPESREATPYTPSSTGAAIGWEDTGFYRYRSQYHCTFPGCTAGPFQSLYLLNSHLDVHPSARPHYCSFASCPRGEGGRGFKRKNEMIRHVLLHDSPGYICPFCPDREHKYPRPDYLERHVRVHHVDKDKDDPLLREVLKERPDGLNKGRRRRGIQGDTVEPPSGSVQRSPVPPEPLVEPDRLIKRPEPPLPPIMSMEPSNQEHNYPPPSPPSLGGHLPFVGSSRRVLHYYSQPANEDAIPNRPDNVEAPFTDSGYASAPPRDSDKAAAASSEDNDNCDSRTIISAATTVLPNMAQHSISEVCNNMYNRIHHQLDDHNLESFFEALPDLLKSFAIRFAHLNPSNTNRRIMHFVYSRHREITSQLRQLFQPDEEDGGCLRTSEDGMSLMDKMNMWASDAEGQSPGPMAHSPDPEWLGNLEDDTEDSLSHFELPLYSRAILDSEAYKQLLEDLRRESLSHSDASRVWTMDTVRHQIMSDLSPTRISKNENPRIHEVEFMVPLRGIKERLSKEAKRSAINNKSHDPSTAVVLVNSSNNYTQAIALGEYIDQTWGPRGSRLLGLVKEIAAQKFETDDSTCTSDGLVSVQHSASTEDTLRIRCKGLSYSITGYGAGLCWMLSALQNSDTEGIVCFNPSVFSARPGEPWEISAQIDTTSGPASNTPGVSALRKLGWFDGYLEPVITQGFPTLRRPPEFPGVELSTAIFLSLVRQDDFRWSDYPRRFSGPRGTLQLVRQKGGLCLWHVVAAESACPCPKDLKLHIPMDVEMSRHVLGDCLQWAFVLPGANNVPPAGDAVPVGSEPPQDNLDDVASNTTNMNHFGSSESTMCPDTSVDSDMMSVPDTPEAATDVPDELAPVLDAVARKLYRGYRDTASGFEPYHDRALAQSPDASQHRRRPLGEHTQCQGQSESTDTSNTTDTQSTLVRSQPTSTNRTKRTRANEDGNDKDGQDEMGPPKKPRRSHTGTLPARKVLACPFWKLDPARYRQCLKLECFWEVNRVKQHLTRKHVEPKIYCDMCKLTFRDEPTKIRHLQQDRATCIYKEWAERLITRTQQGELHKKSKADTERDKWFDIWDILFPGVPRPHSPFIDESVSEDFRHFREYTGRRGRIVLLEQLQAAGFTHRNEIFSEDAMESYRLETVERALDFILDDFLANRASSERSATERGSSGSGSPRRATPASSLADSGMDLSLNPTLEMGDSLDSSGYGALGEFSFEFGNFETPLDFPLFPENAGTLGEVIRGFDAEDAR